MIEMYALFGIIRIHEQCQKTVPIFKSLYSFSYFRSTKNNTIIINIH